MIFYENTLRMRIPYHHIYRIHQHLDFFIQEECRIKTPYSFKIIPGVENDNDAAVILLRTVQPLKMAGERKQEIFLKTGDAILFTTMLAAIRHTTEGNRQTTLPPEQVEGYARRCLERAGFSIQSLLVNEPENIVVKSRKTKRDPSILIPASVVHATGIITAVGEAEKALVYGIGKKRIFGFGFLEHFRVNNADEFY